MRIAIHINRTVHQFPKSFNYELAAAMANQYPEDEFVLIYDEGKMMHSHIPANCVAVSMKPRIKNNLLLRFWYGFKIHKMLPRFKPDVFITAGDIICPRTSIPQVLIIHRNQSAEKKMRKYLYSHRAGFAKKACCSFVCGRDVSVTSVPGDLPLLKPGIDSSFHPREAAVTEKTKIEFSDGKEYFLYLRNEESALSLITLLKSFSIFKKWQQSEMKLIIVSHDDSKPFIEDFEHYKYRDDVALLAMPAPEVLGDLLAAAYAGLTSSAVAWNDPGLLMMACGVPVISVRCGQNDAVFEDACLSASSDETDISTKLMQLYKNEELRKDLIRSGSALIKTYDWNRCARTIRENISLS